MFLYKLETEGKLKNNKDKKDSMVFFRYNNRHGLTCKSQIHTSTHTLFHNKGHNSHNCQKEHFIKNL